MGGDEVRRAAATGAGEGMDEMVGLRAVGVFDPVVFLGESGQILGVDPEQSPVCAEEVSSVMVGGFQGGWVVVGVDTDGDVFGAADSVM